MPKAPKAFVAEFEVELVTEGKTAETVTLLVVPDGSSNEWLGVRPHGRIEFTVKKGDFSGYFRPGARFGLLLTPKVKA